MTDNRTTELLKDYAFALRRLEYDTDKPGSNMTLGEYEKEEERITDEYAQAIAATLGSEREAKLIRAMEDVLRHATDTVWVGEAETLVDRMVSLGVYKHDVYEGVRPWEATNER